MEFITLTRYIVFLPIILRDTLGFGIAASQCLVCPPYVAAAVLMMFTAWYGDRLHVRGPLIIMNCFIALIGLPIAGFANNPWVRYFGIFVSVAAVNSCIPTIMTYQVSDNLMRTMTLAYISKANNIRGQWKRAFCSASLTGIAGIGGISGSLVYRSQDAPGYVPGVSTTIG